jgi:four helix bundle protein
MIDFKDLKVWQKARQLCIEAYRIRELFPSKERFRLTDRMCRAGLSGVNNIAEGFGRGGGKDFAYHLRIARGSVGEVRCCAVVATDLAYVIGDRETGWPGRGNLQDADGPSKNVGGLT